MPELYTIKYNNTKILIGKNVFSKLLGVLHSNNIEFSQLQIICDTNTSRYSLSLLEPSLIKDNIDYNVIIVPSGDENKSIHSLIEIWRTLINSNSDKDTLIVNLGGGMISDIGGFTASTYKRGVRYINIPTSLMGQVDAAIGGKTGINFMNYKNQLGVIYDPVLIINDSKFFETLPEREYRSAYAELIKYGLISDADLLEELLNCSEDFLTEPENISDIIKRANEIKLIYVNQDPQDKNVRNVLNFGHTIGHGVESTYNSFPVNSMLHGEAISVGIICELYISNVLFDLPMEILKKVQHFLIDQIGYFGIDADKQEKIFHNLAYDKKNKKREIIFTLLKNIGQPLIHQSVENRIIEESIEYYKTLK